MTDADNSAKSCCVCNKLLSLSEFHKDKSKKDGRVSTCKECAKARARKWFVENHERGVRARKLYYQANIEARQASIREYSRSPQGRESTRRSRAKEKYKQKKVISDKEWKSLNPDKVRGYHVISQMRRRAAGDVNANDVVEILKSQRFKCAICRVSVRKKRHVDHIKPIKMGGTSDRNNLQILCQTCNVRKHAKDPIDYMRELGRLI